MKIFQFTVLAVSVLGTSFLFSCTAVNGPGVVEAEPDRPTGIALPAGDPNAPSAY